MSRLPLTLLCLVLAQGSLAAPLEERVKKLERMLSSGTLMELLDKVEQMQRDVRAMRGELEEQRHGLDQMKRRQRDLYLDVDKRLQAVESGPAPAVGAAAGPAPAAPATTTVIKPAPSPAPVTPSLVRVDTAPGAAIETTDSGDAAREQQDYQQAFNLLKEARFDKAEQAFKAFLKDFPNGSYSDNAQYWLAETFYVTRQYKPALEEFSRLLSQYPDSPKLSHAMLKVGYIQHELGEIDSANSTLNDLQQKFPKTSAARLARERLARIKRETRPTP